MINTLGGAHLIRGLARGWVCHFFVSNVQQIQLTVFDGREFTKLKAHYFLNLGWNLKKRRRKNATNIRNQLKLFNVHRNETKQSEIKKRKRFYIKLFPNVLRASMALFASWAVKSYRFLVFLFVKCICKYGCVTSKRSIPYATKW